MNERVRDILRNPFVIPTAVGVACFASGFGGGYILGKKKAEKTLFVTATFLDDDADDKNDDQLELNFDVSNLLSDKKEESVPLSPEELDSLRLMGDKHNPVSSPRFVIPEDAYVASLRGYEDEDDEDEDYGEDPPVPRDPRPDPRDIIVNDDAVQVMEQAAESGSPMTAEEAVKINIFATSGDNWDYEKELEGRSPDQPYIIHRDEFFAEEMDYSQLTLTFYEGDEIMVDDQDAPVYNWADITGPLHWGHGSDDPNVVYIRNDKRKAEFEVLRHTGLYSSEVLGIEIEENARVRDLKHSESPRKFRTDN